MDCVVVTFAHWEEGFLVSPRNPKKIRSVGDLARKGIRVVNRERGSGARRLLDRQLDRAGIPARRVTGYGNEARSHLDVARLVAAGVADVGIAVRAAAKIYGVDFISLERERYDLIIPRIYYELPTLAILLDTIVGQPFRSELEAMGGYDTRDTGQIVPLR
jgi:molybdate-binding protein